MHIRILLLMSIFLIQTSYSLKPAYSITNPSSPVTTTAIPSFTAVNIIGNMNVNLHTGYRKPALILMGDPNTLKQVKVTVAQGVLFLSLKDNQRPCCTPISVDIRTRYLNGLVYQGNGSITGQNLRANLEQVRIDNQGTTILKGTIRLGDITVSGRGYTEISGVVGPHLRVHLSGPAKLRLMGVASLRHLEMKDHSWFSLSWVKSPSLILCASEYAYIELAGIVNKLDAQLWNSAQLNARYLRARRAYVKTHDNSIAKIATTEHQHTLATDASDIQFYNLPEMKTDFMAFDGAVLDMRAFNTPFVEEPTPYNY